MNKEEIIKKLRDMAKYPTITLPRDTEALRNAADLLEQAQQAEPKQWIGLSQKDKNQIVDDLGLMDVAWIDLMEAIEFRLKVNNAWR